jgi:hypothetical protein
MSHAANTPRTALRTQDDPVHKKLVQDHEAHAARKRKKFSELNATEKDTLLCEVATRLGLVEKE